MVDEIYGVDGASWQGHAGAPSDAGPLVSLQISLSRTVWRIGPAWSVLGGALVAGAPILSADALLRFAAAAALADIAWGVLRRAIPAQPAAALVTGPVIPSLPYAQADSPLAQLLGNLASRQGRSLAEARRVLQELFIGLAFTILLSFLLPRPAFIVSAAAVAGVAVSWAWIRRGQQPAFCYAWLDVGLPWLLGAILAWGGTLPTWPVLLLGAGFTLLQWGDHRWWLTTGKRPGGAWLGMAAVLGALIVLRRPWALVLVAGLFLPAAGYLLRARGAGFSAGAWRAHILPWWWAALLFAALLTQ